MPQETVLLSPELQGSATQTIQVLKHRLQQDRRTSARQQEKKVNRRAIFDNFSGPSGCGQARHRLRQLRQRAQHLRKQAIRDEPRPPPKARLHRRPLLKFPAGIRETKGQEIDPQEKLIRHPREPKQEDLLSLTLRPRPQQPECEIKEERDVQLHAVIDNI